VSKKKITDEQVTEFIRLHQAGQSYRTIGKKYQVDPRTVKSWVERANQEKEKEHWEIVSRQVDTKYLDEHYQLLIIIAARLQNVVQTKSMDFTYKQDADELIDNAIQLGLRQVGDLLKERGIDPTNRLSRRLLEALMEHEPQLKIALDNWKSRWNGFEKVRSELAQQAGSLFEQKKLSHKVAETLGIAVAREGIKIRLLGEEPYSSKVEDISNERVRLIRHNQQVSGEVYKGPKQEVEAAKNAYEFVLPQISHEERMRPIKDAYKSLMVSAQAVEDFVERLVLIGRPQGRCSLCPGRPNV
jgi:transposase